MEICMSEIASFKIGRYPEAGSELNEDVNALQSMVVQ
jgi:hypothetical protein